MSKNPYKDKLDAQFKGYTEDLAEGSISKKEFESLVEDLLKLEEIMDASITVEQKIELENAVNIIKSVAGLVASAL